MRERGYTPNDTSDYHSDQALRVLVGTRTGSGDGYGQQAFFFVNGRYIGTDTKEPSATLKVVSQSDTEVTLGYPLYRRSDPLAARAAAKRSVTLPAQQRQADAARQDPAGRSELGLEPLSRGRQRGAVGGRVAVRKVRADDCRQTREERDWR